MSTAFQGEHLLPGQLGQFFVVLAFGSALLAAISYYFATTNSDKIDRSWHLMGRYSFFINTISVIGIAASLFYIIFNHLFEYHYAWAHSSRALPTYYIISCFWEGQEGSFWLFAFWQAVLGNILIWKAKTWEKPVMTIVSLSQVFLSSMLLGVEVFGSRVGSSPFILLRDAIPGPIFSRPDYLTFIKDGNGLNPLLQNYWMVIHPPTLFLGFGSMVVPFAYAIAGLWQKRYGEWIRQALPYTLFAVMVLGTGIIMGSFWAYESLNFGGFWAWDPVENASMIPWLTLIGAVHVLIVYKNTGHSYFTATFLVLISFVLVLYASFLSRSGILGQTSVHSFTDAGLKWHLLIHVLLFLALSVYLLAARWKELPISKKDEETYSREFWLFVGSVFLGLSCFHMVFVTSFPVWNWVFGSKLTLTEPVKHYNVIQASFAVVVTLLTGFTQFLKYKKTDTTRFFIMTGVYLLCAVAIGLAIVFASGINHLHFVFSVVMVGAIYSILTNGKVLADAFAGKLKLAGSAVAHIGFGLLLVGAIIAAGTSKVVSENNSGIGFGDEFAKNSNPKENIMLYRNQPVKMGDYQITYMGDSVAKPNHYFKINYKKLDASGKVTEEFVLKPNSQANNKMGLVSSPDTKHYLFHDLYTHITMAPIKGDLEDATDADHSEAAEDKKYDPAVPYTVSAGDTIRFREGFMVFRGLQKESHIENIPIKNGDVAVGAVLDIETHGQKYHAEPIYLIRGGSVFDFAKKVDDAGLKLRLTKIIPNGTNAQVEISVQQQPESAKPYVVMRAINFPFINFFWAGTILMVVGFLLSIFRRNKELRRSETVKLKGEKLQRV